MAVMEWQAQAAELAMKACERCFRPFLIKVSSYLDH